MLMDCQDSTLFLKKSSSQEVSYYVNSTVDERHYPFSFIVVLESLDGEEFYIEYDYEDFILALGVADGNCERLMRLLTESAKDIIRKGWAKGHVTVIDTMKGESNHE